MQYLSIRVHGPRVAEVHSVADASVVIRPARPLPVAPQVPPAARTLGQTFEALLALGVLGLVAVVPVLANLIWTFFVSYFVNLHPVTTCKTDRSLAAISSSLQTPEADDLLLIN